MAQSGIFLDGIIIIMLSYICTCSSFFLFAHNFYHFLLFLSFGTHFASSTHRGATSSLAWLDKAIYRMPLLQPHCSIWGHDCIYHVSSTAPRSIRHHMIAWSGDVLTTAARLWLYLDSSYLHVTATTVVWLLQVPYNYGQWLRGQSSCLGHCCSQ